MTRDINKQVLKSLIRLIEILESQITCVIVNYHKNDKVSFPEKLALLWTMMDGKEPPIN